MRNMKAICLAILTALACATVALWGEDEVTVKKIQITAEQLQTRDGGELYQSLCAACHGETGAGDGPAATALRSQPANLTVLTDENGGKYPFLAVQTDISGRYRVASEHIDMPAWEDLLRRSTGNPALARQMIYNLNRHVKTLQVAP